MIRVPIVIVIQMQLVDTIITLFCNRYKMQDPEERLCIIYAVVQYIALSKSGELTKRSVARRA